MTRYLLTYADCIRCDTEDEDGGAGALGLFDSRADAIAAALFEIWNSGIWYTDPGDWYRVDVYSYDGEIQDADDIYEDLDAIDDGDDGDVLHMGVSADGLVIAFSGDAVRYDGRCSRRGALEV